MAKNFRVLRSGNSVSDPGLESVGIIIGHDIEAVFLHVVKNQSPITTDQLKHHMKQSGGAHISTTTWV